MRLKQIHGTSVAIEDSGVLIIGSSGSGKSDLALRLIDSGATLIGDDITICEKKNNKVFLFPNQKIKGLIEIRGVGIIKVPYVDNILLNMFVELTEDPIDRLPPNENKSILGVKVPKIKVVSKEVSATAKIKLKLYEQNQDR